MPHVEPAMHAITVVLVSAVLATSCGAVGRPAAAPSPTPPTEPPADRIYAEVIRQLVTVDHTFGDGPTPFRHVYVVDGVISAEALSQVGPAAQPFPETLKRAIADRLKDLPPLDFIRDPDTVRLEGLEGVRKDGVIISLGPIEPAGDDVHVPAGLWCGGLCGQWLTYVLMGSEGEWQITGTTGPVAIA